MPTKVWASGEEVSATDMNTYLQQQVIPTFANAAARTTAIPSPTEGMVSYITGSGWLEIFKGGIWRPPVGTVVTTGFGTFANINSSTNALYNVGDVSSGVTYPYPVYVVIMSSLYGGFGGSAVTVNVDLQRLDTTTSVWNSPGNIVIPGGSFQNLGTTASWLVAAGASTGARHRVNFLSGSNIHTGGHTVWQHIAA